MEATRLKLAFRVVPLTGALWASSLVFANELIVSGLILVTITLCIVSLATELYRVQDPPHSR